MAFEYVDVNDPGCGIRSPRRHRIGRWVGPAGGGEFDQRFPPLPEQRRAEILREVRQRRDTPAVRRERAARRSLQPADSWTYLVGAEGSSLVKVGWAKNPKKRVAALQTGSPVPLTLLWSAEGAYEEYLHAEFAAFRVRGEWFDFATVGDPVEAVRDAVEQTKTPGSWQADTD